MNKLPFSAPPCSGRGILWIILYALIGLLPTYAHATNTLQAQVDRTAVEVGDTLTLSLRLNDSGNDAPDLSALEKDFSILGQSSSSGLSAGIGHIERWTEWQITLTPLRAGKLTIPAFTVAGASSQPIAIQANTATSQPNSGDDPVFVEAKLDSDNVYVQQQILLTVRIYLSIPLSDMNITEPEFDNATVRKLAQDKFQRSINGRSYQVHELTYAIFPQQSGDLTIPELVFTGSEAQAPRSIFDFPRQGRTVRKLTQQMTVHVKPIPKQFSGKTWLPARHLTLQETWGGDPNALETGNSVTRSVAVQADGVMASQLPTLDLPKIQDAKLYADKPALDDQGDAQGMHGKRVESAALIPTRPGALNLPEMQVHWWDLDSDSEKIATIPTQTLNIAGAANTSQTPVNSPAAESDQRIQSVSETHREPNDSDSKIVAADVPLFWYTLSGILALAWLVTLSIYWRLKRALQKSSIAAPQNSTAVPADTTALDAAIDACAVNDAAAALQALNRWVRSAHPATPTLSQWLHSLDATACADVKKAVAELDQFCYSNEESSGDWEGRTLAEILKREKQSRRNKRDATASLPSLYPV